jgi:hypothetical protein
MVKPVVPYYAGGALWSPNGERMDAPLPQHADGLHLMTMAAERAHAIARAEYRLGWRWGLVCGLVCGSCTTICAWLLITTVAGAL